MQYAGSTSWQITLDDRDERAEYALWIRAAERIEVPIGGVVPGPLDLDPPPVPSQPSGAPLVEAWLYWWRIVQFPQEAPAVTPAEAFEGASYGPPDFSILTTYPSLREVAVARWPEALVWRRSRDLAHRAAARHDQAARSRGREGQIVREVEAEIGHKAAPFVLRIVILPVVDTEIRRVGDDTYLVPAQVRATAGYDTWLREVVRALA
jgi:hypothetical protein